MVLHRRTSMAVMRLDPITTEILWTRLIAIVDEAAATMERTAFSTLVRESNDYAVVLTDIEGRSLAQNTKSIPSFIATLPITVQHFLRRFPLKTLREGDVLCTNDPWLATGHLPDITVAMPIFVKGKPVAIAAACSHMPDIGGRVRNIGIRENYEEGLRIPPLYLMRRGKVDEAIVAMIRANNRVPDETMGDVWALVASCRMMARRIDGLLKDTPVEFAALGREIQRRSEAAMRSAIRAVPNGTYRATIRNDGFDGEPITIACAVTVKDDSLVVDYTGSTMQLPKGVNVPPNYTFALSAYGVKCVLSPSVPNNEGSFRTVKVHAPEGSILNPRFPAACGARHAVGHLLAPAVMLALAEAVPNQVRAAPGSPGSAFTLSGEHKGRRYAILTFVAPGLGGSAHSHGHSAVHYPTNLSNTPIEVMEYLAPLRFHERSIRRGSGGAGRHRGGDGMTFSFDVLADQPGMATFILNRRHEAPPGLFGGEPGKLGRCEVNGAAVDPALHHVLKAGDHVLMETAGGGGYGKPQ
ncbi:MAG: hydantoinase B/oxoprolinase family protein [Alphaproteobacteria bacterium]|nr:hydantoinase B/oxoprolinase family protein [Alphaproteobacteria bacterium]